MLSPLLVSGCEASEVGMSVVLLVAAVPFFLWMGATPEEHRRAATEEEVVWFFFRGIWYTAVGAPDSPRRQFRRLRRAYFFQCLSIHLMPVKREERKALLEQATRKYMEKVEEILR
jgi:hypothetical protein